MIKLNILLVKGRINSHGLLLVPNPSTPIQHLLRMYKLDKWDLSEKYGKGYKDKVKVRIVTKQEDLRGIRLEDWIVLEDQMSGDYQKLLEDKTKDFLTKKLLGGICE